ncbi:hypothetical protein KR51_00003460 [Rubidibacter lacunae KORDI 51-2]|uniref:Uncharacterized protein n=1 Tax=Rubidibacter lacunae KORDI 51-2 TaxID=582515 RepID=U5DTM9_9CHRO|nr:hypothetical protein KR51_00003460 [Rubidibacter lacunae KORDI 51-2]
MGTAGARGRLLTVGSWANHVNRQAIANPQDFWVGKGQLILPSGSSDSASEGRVFCYLPSAWRTWSEHCSILYLG